MEQYFQFQINRVLDGPIVASFGTFDGVHRGHAFIFERMKQEAALSGAKLALLTFSNHPMELLSPGRQPFLLTSHEQKNAQIKASGIDVLIDLPFTEMLKNMTADEFLQAFRKMTPFNTLVVGKDVSFGKDKKGTKELLAERSEFDLILLDRYSVDSYEVSSSLIRQKILDGDIDLAKRLLGRPYTVTAKFENHGSKWQLFAPQFVLPRSGSYEVLASCKDHTLKFRAKLSITSILEISPLDYADAFQLPQGFVDITL